MFYDSYVFYSACSFCLCHLYPASSRNFPTNSNCDFTKKKTKQTENSARMHSVEGNNNVRLASSELRSVHNGCSHVEPGTHAVCILNACGVCGLLVFLAFSSSQFAPLPSSMDFSFTDSHKFSFLRASIVGGVCRRRSEAPCISYWYSYN